MLSFIFLSVVSKCVKLRIISLCLIIFIINKARLLVCYSTVYKQVFSQRKRTCFRYTNSTFPSTEIIIHVLINPLKNNHLNTLDTKRKRTAAHFKSLSCQNSLTLKSGRFVFNWWMKNSFNPHNALGNVIVYF